MNISSDIIQGCLNGSSQSQKVLYNKLSPYLLGVARRYISDAVLAEDMMIESMYKVLTKIQQFSGEGNFVAWARRICVNECLMSLRKNKTYLESIDDSHLQIGDVERIEGDIAAKDILSLLEKLPTGYRTVFNMYIIEGYKHREIAEKLGISINTSKSQLILAKKKMLKLWEELNKTNLD